MEYVHFLIDFLLHIDVHLAQMVAQYGVWVYAILFAIIFCETGLVVTPFLPGDSLLFVGGALAALPTNELNVHLLVLAVAVAAVSGDAANYTIGRLFGEKLFRIRIPGFSNRVTLRKRTLFMKNTAEKQLFWRDSFRS